MSGEHGEPWTVDEYDSVIFDDNCDKIGEIYNHRIVACVNALDGVATENLTPGCVKVMVEALVSADKLLANIQQYGAMAHESDWRKCEIVWGEIRAALAAMKGA